jgi:DAACS family dicarboxylate/amino acid:cation (Na+ or H+) symporter
MLNANVMEPIGQIFLRLLFLTVVPLVFASLAVGVAQIGSLGAVGRVGGKTLGYFLLISTIAAIIGIALVNMARPGEGLPPETVEELQRTYGGDAAKRKKADFTVLEFVKQVIPNNPVSAAANLEMLGIITFAILIGIGITQLETAKAELIAKFLEAVGELMVFIIHLAMKLAPLGVFCLIFTTTSQFGFGLLTLLGKYAAVVLVGLAIQGFVVLPLFVKVFTGMGPRTFFHTSSMALVSEGDGPRWRATKGLRGAGSAALPLASEPRVGATVPVSEKSCVIPVCGWLQNQQGGIRWCPKYGSTSFIS